MAIPAADHDTGSGRPALDARGIRLAYDAARSALGPNATIEAIAEKLDRSPRTVRAWKARFDL
jgi:transposase